MQPYAKPWSELSELEGPSSESFLAKKTRSLDPSANQILQAGPNVIFEYDGKVVAVQESVSPVPIEAVEQELGFWEWLVSMLEWIFD